MPQKETEAKLMREMKHYFPPRWRVSKIKTKVKGGEAHGTIKIRCITDSKTFLSDFDALLGSDGRISELRLDGVRLTGRAPCLSGLDKTA